MPIVVWKNEYETGIAEIDNQHKRLVEIINSIIEKLHSMKANSILLDILIELIEYSDYHFRSEEKLLIKINYPDYNSHRNEHIIFMEKLTKFGEDYSSGKANVIINVLKFLQSWLNNHILEVDLKYAEYIKSSNIKIR